MMPKLIIFDLDGTINDSSPGISYCYRRTAETYGINDMTEERLRTGLSGPFETNISNILDLEDSEVPEAIRRYVEFYTAEGRYMCQLFPRVKETLEYLRNKGYLIGMATMMVDEYARDTLRKYGILGLFDTIHGASLTVPHTKEDLVRSCLDDAGVSPADAVLVGDGSDDHRAAVVSGTDFIAARYGYELDREYCERNSIRGIDSIDELTGLFRSVDDPET